MKRFFATLLALVMCLSMVPTAFAITEDTAVAENINVADEDGWVLLELPSSNEDGSVAVPYGGGTETWKWTGFMSENYVGSFTMEGNNLTPVKTLDPSLDGGLNLEIIANYTCSTKVRLTVQIRKAYTSTVLAEDNSGYNYSTSGGANPVALNLKPGDKVQIYFRIVKDNGVYDDNLKCNISYSYSLRYNDY